jgi:hypothetical protein
MCLSAELERRRAWLKSGGTVNNYPREHYKKEETNESNNNINARQHKEH